MESFCDGVVFGKSPHTGDGIDPLVECFGECNQIGKILILKLLNELEEFTGVFPTLLGRTSFFAKQGVDLPFFEIERFQGRILPEEFPESFELLL